MMTPHDRRSFWMTFFNVVIAGALAGAILVALPVRAQVNIKKIGKDTGARIKGAAENDSTAKAANEAMTETEAPAEPATAAEPVPPTTGTTPAATPAAGSGPGNGDPGLKPDNLDTYGKQRKPTAEESNALKIRVFDYMRYILESKPDVRQRTFDGRQPWISRAPRTNPFDPQIVQPIKFNNLDLNSAPPPPYYPPAGGIKQANLQDQFQKFLDECQLTGIIIVKGTKFALIKFGKSTKRMKIGDEFEQKDYVIRVKDIGKDSVVLATREGDLQGLLALGAVDNLYVGEGERSLVIVSGSDKDQG